MRLHRFIGNFDLSGSEVVIAEAEVIHQLTRVLRLIVHDKLILCDGRGMEAQGEIMEMEKDLVRVKIEKAVALSSEPTRQVTLYLAVLKGEHFELAVEKATECGVFRIVPMQTERTVKTGLRMERLRTIIKEAVEQSGRGMVPELCEVKTFSEALDDAKSNQQNIIFDPRAEAFKKPGEDMERVGIFIGPEGGFTDAEVALADGQDVVLMTLGARILRAETAAIVATYLMQ